LFHVTKEQKYNDLPYHQLDEQQDAQEEDAMEMIVRQEDHQAVVVSVTGRMDAVTASQLTKDWKP